MKHGFRKITAVCVPAELFTDGYDLAAEMRVPGKRIVPGREKYDPAALLLATAAIMSTWREEGFPDLIPALEQSGFVVKNIVQMNQIQSKMPLPYHGVLVNDARVQAYLYGGPRLSESAGLNFWEVSSESVSSFQNETHFAAADRNGQIIYLGSIKAHRIPKPDAAAMEQLAAAEKLGIRILLNRRTSSSEYRPPLKIIGKEEKAMTVTRKDFADYVRDQNRIVKRNRIIAGIFFALLTVCIIVLFLMLK